MINDLNEINNYVKDAVIKISNGDPAKSKAEFNEINNKLKEFRDLINSYNLAVELDDSLKDKASLLTQLNDTEKEINRLQLLVIKKEPIQSGREQRVNTQSTATEAQDQKEEKEKKNTVSPDDEGINQPQRRDNPSSANTVFPFVNQVVIEQAKEKEEQIRPSLIFCSENRGDYDLRIGKQDASILIDVQCSGNVMLRFTVRSSGISCKDLPTDTNLIAPTKKLSQEERDSLEGHIQKIIVQRVNCWGAQDIDGLKENLQHAIDQANLGVTVMETKKVQEELKGDSPFQLDIIYHVMEFLTIHERSRMRATAQDFSEVLFMQEVDFTDVKFDDISNELLYYKSIGRLWLPPCHTLEQAKKLSVILELLQGKNISTLQLEGEYVSDRHLRQISKLKSLCRLDFLQCPKITNKGVKDIAENLKLLTSLSLFCCRKVSDEGVQAIVDNLPELLSLELIDSQFTNNGLNAIAFNLRKLHTLRVSNNYINGEGIETIAKNLKELVRLSVVGCEQFSNKGINAIASNLKLLETLALGHTDITDEGIEVIAASLPGLTHLYLDTTSISNKGARAIATRLKKLTSLSLSNTDIDDAGVKAIVANLPDLTDLNLLNCTHISEKVAYVIAAHSKKLKELYIDNTKISEDGIKAIMEATSGRCKIIRR